jgi:hypothetical protein
MADAGILHCVESVKRTMIAARPIARGILAEIDVAEALAPQGPMHEEAQGRVLGPLFG